MIVKPDIEEFAEYPYAESATLRVSRAEYQVLRTALRHLIGIGSDDLTTDLSCDMYSELNAIREEMTNS